MRSPYLVHGLLTGLLLVACGKTDPAATDSGSATDTDSGTDTDAVTSTTDSSGGSNSGGNDRVPGMSVACACPDGTDGAQTCAPDGKSFGTCECAGGSGSDSNATTSPTTTNDPTNDVTTDPTNATTDPTNATTTTDGTTGGSTTTDGTTGGSTTGGNVCDDPGFEPNEDEDTAEDLGDKGCGEMAGTVMGVLDGDTDVDFSTFHGVDGMACGFNNPFISVTLTASDAVRLCVYTDCDNGTPMFMCPMGSMFTMSPNGLPGCCGCGDMSFQFNCSNSQNESADVYVSVDQAPVDSCVDWSVGYAWGAPP